MTINLSNDGVSKKLASLSYASVDVVAQRIVTLGQGALLTKTYIKVAYFNVPVHPQDRLLLGRSNVKGQPSNYNF